MDPIPLYEQFADELEAQILAGTFPEGSRLPSLREAATSRGVSMSTAIQAFRLLEDRGLAEARPQSGYYVKRRHKAPKIVVEADIGPVDPMTVSIDELSMSLFRDKLDPGFAPFGAASPDPALLPIEKLDRIVASIAREGGFAQDSSLWPEGLEELRRSIAQRAFASGFPITPDEIVITAGCTEAMSLCLLATCRAGDLVAIESPGYFGLLLILEALGLHALEIPALPGTGLSLDALEFALDNHPVKALVAMTNFSNPLGALMPEESKDRLASILGSRGIPLIENDIYGELYFGEKRPSVAKSRDDENIMLCSSFSKDISPGYRIGWVAAGSRTKEIVKRKMALTSGASVLPQLAIARYLESGGYDAHLRAIRRAYARRVQGMVEAIEASFPEGTSIAEPEGGYLIWVRLPRGVDSMELYAEAARARIAIAPGTLFSPSRKHKDYIRLNASVWSQKTEKDLVRLGTMVERLAGKARR
ncbi:MAG: PLP-dependent aminotransferase family protein [Treponema sp.]|nr:PLP-dependent aminotransferase family protein [Treponema sp.]